MIGFAIFIFETGLNKKNHPVECIINPVVFVI
jgi:hypothetical protein